VVGWGKKVCLALGNGLSGAEKWAELGTRNFSFESAIAIPQLEGSTSAIEIPQLF
jgi:hypothetical protein